MINELKLIVDAIAGLPAIMVWVLLGYLVYKLAVVGSIYALIRFCIEKAHHAYTTRHQIKTVELRATINSMCICADGSNDALVAELYRLRGKGTEIPSMYIHRQSVVWLREAIDAKEQIERLR